MGLSDEGVIAVMAATGSVLGGAGEAADVTVDESGTAVAKLSSASRSMFLIRKSMTPSSYKCCLTASTCTQHMLAMQIKEQYVFAVFLIFFGCQLFLQSTVQGSSASSVQWLQEQETLSVKAAAHVADDANCLQLVSMMYHLKFAYHLQRLYFDIAMHERA